jgi:hypothetical protein
MWFTKVRQYWDKPLETGVVKTRPCDVSGCPSLGEFKAPKSRDSLRDYYWFCIDHVREYNQSRAEIETHLKKTIVGDRPTWRSTRAGLDAERLKHRIYERFAAGDDVFGDFGGDEEGTAHVNLGSIPHPATDALATLGLKPPVDWNAVKARYKSLVKQYHPDVNEPDPALEEQMKKINMAYSILKISYQTYSDLEGKK